MTNLTQNLTEDTKNALQTIDITLRCISLFTHVLYFVIVFVVKELNSKSLIYIHQVNFYGMVFSLHYCLYINTRTPDLGEAKLDETLCSLSEILWASLKSLRAFSILELAVFRLTALVHLDVFCAWIRSPFRLAAPMLANLLVSVGFAVTLKFTLATTYGPYLCLDGFSPVLARALIYFLVSSVLGICVPCTLVCLIYAYKISYLRRSDNKQRRGRDLNLKVWSTRKYITDIYASMQNNNNSKNEIALTVLVSRNQRKLARQVLVMNAFLVLSLLSFILTNVSNMFEQLNDYGYPLRSSLRISTIFFQAFVPIVSIAGHTKMMNLVKKFRFNKIFPS